MNRYLNILLLGACLLAGRVFAADSFDGKITYALSTGRGQPQTLSYVTKDSVARVDLGSGEGGTILDFNKREMTILMHQQKMYMVRPMPQEMVDQVNEKSTSAEIEVTGKTEKILGYKCSQILIKDDQNVTEVWLAEGLGNFMGLGAGANPASGKKGADAAAAWEKALHGKSGVPLRVSTKDKSGKETYRMEATKVEKGGVKEADLAPPSDYKKFEMPDFGGMNPFKKH